jgi:HSP20 family protein
MPNPDPVTKRKPPSKHSGLVGVVVDHAVYRSFSQFSQAQAWSPAVNIYQVGRLMHICVDLAGIDRDKIDVRIEPGRLTVSGVRHAPEPKPAATTPPAQPDVDMKIHSMEIDYGAFCRVIPVPQQVNLDGVRSEYRQGLLWITLPLT